MEKIFYADKSAFPSSLLAVENILSTYFGVSTPKINRTENGKPYLENYKKLFFSVSHTKDRLFIAFGNGSIGLDVERLDREVNYLAIIKKFPFEEREEISCKKDFLKHWTIKESAIKCLGGTLAHDLNKLSYVKGILRYEQLELPLHVSVQTFEECVIAVCSEKVFSNAEFIPL